MTPSRQNAADRHDTFDGNRHDTPEAATVITVTGKSGKGTARQTIRMDEDLWEKLGAASVNVEGGRSAVLREFARWYVHEKGARMPKRPAIPVLGEEQASD